MKNKLINNLLKPNLKTNFATMFVFACIIIYYNVVVGVISLSILLYLIFYNWKIEDHRKRMWKEYIENITDEMDGTIKHALVNHPIPLTIIDEEGAIIWYNKNFSDTFENIEFLHRSIDEIVPGFKYSDLLKKDDADKVFMTTINGKIFKIISNIMDPDNVKTTILYLIDITNFETLKNLYRDERDCFAYLHVDNYEDLLSSSPEDKRAVIAAQIEKLIRQWGTKIFASMTKYDDDKYFVVFENRHLEKLEANKFSILDEVREIETDADFPVSLSIGIGVGGKNPSQLDEYAAAALDLALGRGGDQTVVKKINKIDYYGGRLQTVEKRNKGKSRIMAHAIRQLIDQSSQVIIMGHKNPDMDAFGAALGIYRIAKNRNKEAAILINYVNDSIENIYQQASVTKNYRFISSETSLSLQDKDTLLVVVDTHRPSFTECPELLNKVDRIVVIDHHRKMEENIDNAVLTYMEPYASSTSELVAEILQYVGDKKEIDKVEAEALLAGITVDTKYFSIKTGVRTFEAASWLRRIGADTANVRQLFQNDVELFKLKAETILNAKMVKDNMTIAICNKKGNSISLVASQAADELLNIKGIKASFVLGENMKNQVVISARSLGDINVQVIMEKMGGGGHLTTAGVQTALSLEEAEKTLIGILDELYLQKEGDK